MKPRQRGHQVVTRMRDDTLVVHDEAFADPSLRKEALADTLAGLGRWGDRAKMVVTPIGSTVHLDSPHPEDPFLVGAQRPPALPPNVEELLLLAEVAREWHTAGYWVLSHRNWNWGFYHAESLDAWRAMLKKYRFAERIHDEIVFP